MLTAKNRWLVGLALFSVVVSLGQAQPDRKPWRVLGDRRVSFPITSVVFSPDRTMLASVGAIYQTGAFPIYHVALVEVASGKTLHQLQTHGELINQIAFSPDGKTLYTGSRPHDGGFSSRGGITLFIWDVGTGKRLRDFKAQTWDVSPDGKVLAINENWSDIDPGFEGRKEPFPSTHALHLYDTSTWKELVQLNDKNITLSLMRFTPDSKTLAMAMSDYTIRLIDWQTKKEKNRILTPKVDPQKYAGGAITCLTFNHDGTRLASCTDTVYLNQVTRKIDIWDTATCKAAQTLDGPQYPIMEIAFTPKGDKLAISARQNYFNLFDLKSGEKLKEWERPGRADLLTALYRDGVTPDQMPKGPPLLTRLWNLGSGEDILQGKLPNELQSLTLSPDNRTVVVGDIKGTIRLYDLATGNDIRQFSDKQKSPVHGLTYLEGGKLLCAQEWSGYLRLWDPDTGTQPKMKLWATPYGKRSLAVSSDGKLAAIVESGPDVTLWKSLKEQKPVNIRLPQGVRRIEFTPDGKKLLCGSWEGVVQVIDVTNNTVLKPIGREHIVMFAVSPDGNTVATWRRTEKYEWDKHLTLWDIDTGAERARINVGPTAFTGMTFTPDGRGLWLPHSAGWAQFEVATGEQRAWVQGHWPISVSKNGRLFVCKAENAIFVWDVTGRNNGGVLDATPLKEEELVKAWTALGGNAYQAYAAIYRLAGVPGQALPFLEKQLKLVTPLDPKRVEKLLIQLNSKVTVEREQAFAELPKYGQWALREVKAALEKKQGPEMRGRLEDLVPLIRDYPAFAEQTQAMRIIELLEQIGTADARRLLETLADGERPQFTEAARAALRRLGKE